MWSRKPIPVEIATVPPSSPSFSSISVSPVLRLISAVLVIGPLVRASIDSAWTGKPSARARVAPAGASAAAAACGGISTVEIRRRKVLGPSGPWKRPAPPVGSTWLEPAT